MSAFILGIGGPSSSGKTSMCLSLSGKLSEFRNEIISLDDYHTSRIGNRISEVSGVKYVDFSNPKYINIQKVMDQITLCSKNSDIVFVEGISALYFPRLRQLYDLMIYLTASPETRLYRRILRNTARENSSIESVGSYHLDSARFAETQFIRNTRAFADLVLDGEFITSKCMDMICEYIIGQIKRGAGNR